MRYFSLTLNTITVKEKVRTVTVDKDVLKVNDKANSSIHENGSNTHCSGNFMVQFEQDVGVNAYSK